MLPAHLPSLQPSASPCAPPQILTLIKSCPPNASLTNYTAPPKTCPTTLLTQCLALPQPTTLTPNVSQLTAPAPL